MKKIRIFSFLLCVVICIAMTSLVGCSSESKVIMSLADKTFTVNTYELLLTRMKGTLEYYGYDVNDESLWKTIISADGSTYDDYFCSTITEQACHYLIADYLFDREGLVLEDEREKEVDSLLDVMVKQAGSKTALNAELKNYGVNYDILRQVYILEQKIDMLRDHLYGEQGEKVTDTVKDQYLEENYVAFGQIFLASYYYVTDLDEFGDAVYYTDDKHTEIAYDKVNGEKKVDGSGKEICDIFGDPVYYNESGKVAYDTDKGVIGYVLSENGEKLTDHYDDNTLGEIYDKAKGYASSCDGNKELFLEYAELYDEADGSGEPMYLLVDSGYYGSQGQSAEYLDEIAKELHGMKIGECKAIESDFGFHIVFKYEVEPKAYDNEKYKDIFSDFHDDLINMLFDKKCSEYESVVTVYKENLDSAPTMASVASNKLY